MHRQIGLASISADIQTIGAPQQFPIQIIQAVAGRIRAIVMKVLPDANLSRQMPARVQTIDQPTCDEHQSAKLRPGLCEIERHSGIVA